MHIQPSDIQSIIRAALEINIFSTGIPGRMCTIGSSSAIAKDSSDPGIHENAIVLIGESFGKGNPFGIGRPLRIDGCPQRKVNPSFATSHCSPLVTLTIRKVLSVLAYARHLESGDQAGA